MFSSRSARQVLGHSKCCFVPSTSGPLTMSVLLSQVMKEFGQYGSSVADVYLFGMGDPYSVFEVGPPPTRFTSFMLHAFILLLFDVFAH